MTRFLDVVFSLIGIVLLSPVFLLVAIWIRLDSKGPVFYRQQRIGRYGAAFSLYKFRSMRLDADKGSLLTFSDTDARITKPGRFIRKYKIDELPQLLNVLAGEMSIVGPRPEVKKYVDLYTEEQRNVLKVRPGITDIASITYYNENKMLESQNDPEQYYIHHIMPDKIRLNKLYIDNPSTANYFRIIFLTIKKALC